MERQEPTSGDGKRRRLDPESAALWAELRKLEETTRPRLRVEMPVAYPGPDPMRNINITCFACGWTKAGPGVMIGPLTVCDECYKKLLDDQE